jgi:O-antigen/teichoic acid export membrane protein
MSIKKNIFYNILLRILNMLFPIVTAPYIARVLGVENLGIANFASSYVNYFIIFAVLGVGYYGVREIAKCKNDLEKVSEIFSGIFKINVISTVIVTIVYVASICYIPELRRHSKIFIISGITLYLAPIAIDWYFQGLENFKMITIRSFVIRCLSFFCLFIFVRQREDIIPYILLATIGTIITNVWNVGYARKMGLKIRWRGVRAKMHLKPMLVLFVASVIGSIFVLLDMLMLGFLSSYEQVGFYVSSARIISIIITGITAINAALIPRLSFNNKYQNHEANKALLQKIFDINSLLIIPMAIGGCLIASRFVPFFFGHEFMGSIVPMQILSFKIIAVILNTFLGSNIFITFGHEKKFLVAIILTSIFSLMMNLVLIPRYGATGASITSLMSECFEILPLLFILFRFTKIRIHINVLFISILFTVPFLALYYLFNKIIDNDMIFFVTFISACAMLYLTLHRYWAKNYLIIQLMNLIINKINKTCNE